MLQTLNTLAGKISPHPMPSMIDNNGNKINHKNNNFNNNIISQSNLNNGYKPEKSYSPPTPYSKRLTMEITTPMVNGHSHKDMESQDQPDPDYIKMFVGQIPRTMDEEDLKVMFSEYGNVHQINVLRDKTTGQSKGCCFLTYYTRKAALDAQNALHNIKILPGMHHPIQMKPADSENRNERKLFVGMLSKKCNEGDIRTMFEQFGTIEECTVLRDTNGISKGCAFVTYTSKQCAINAIRAMHQSHIMEGCSSPLVVKFADTQKDKDQKKMQQIQSSIWNMAGISLSPQSYLATAALSQQLAAAAANSSESHSCLTPLQLLQQQIQASAVTNGHSNYNSLSGLLLHTTQSNDLHGLNTLTGTSALPTDLNSVNLQGLPTLANLSVPSTNVNPIHVQNLMSLAALGSSLTSSAFPGLTSTTAAALLGKKASGLLSNATATSLGALNGFAGTTNPLDLNQRSLLSPSGGYNQELGNCELIVRCTPNPPHEFQYYDDRGQEETSASALPQYESAICAAGKDIQGPEGSNLFIYHLPHQCTDLDLASLFVPYGNVISAKVYIDKVTKKSRCFGFVSYDNPLTAQSAIQKMNGMPLGNKRLKVQLRRPKDVSKPY